ncbi:cysteine--tRNA ligase [Candidatus Daviesbacteria bacterium]|nr:cysteine--tRNA ligase [Candidatus Daviesbacteria bacterium]
MKLFNSLTQTKEYFEPLKRKQVLMYVCGITPYDTTHLGHAFLYIHFDVLFRYLNFRAFKVNYTQNVTDIDDSILEKAKELKTDWQSLGDFWTKQFLEDLDKLNVLRPTHFVKATDSITKIVEIIKKLVKEDLAYIKGGNVYYEVSKFPNYGKLSHFNRNQMLLIAGERGANIKDPNKRNQLDFILWQNSKIDEPSWDSPWGKGRPGWHIECSAMINQYLGDQIDIHGGGRDLIFPHHESEIAQSESFTKKSPLVKYWMHASMLMYQGEKMSKSLGNLVMVSDLLKKYDPNAIRLNLLSHHYRMPWEFDIKELEQATKFVGRIQKAISKLGPRGSTEKINYFNTKFNMAIEDDLDIPEALNVIKELLDKIDQGQDEQLKLTLKLLVSILGLKFIN